MTTDRDFIGIVDFGGQYAHLIAKRIRHLGVFSKIFSPSASRAELGPAKGLILSGGPESVYGDEAVPFNSELLDLRVPLLGLCYGHQLLAHHLGGEVRHLGHGEYGRAEFYTECASPSPLLEGVPAESVVWMSHGDTPVRPPADFEITGTSRLCPVAAMAHRERPIFGLQFHPEVNDTEFGNRILANFVKITGARTGWSIAEFVKEAVEDCKTQVGGRNVLMFLSGGVDSTVAFSLLTRSLGKARVKGLLIDNGFLRLDEAKEVMARYRKLGFENVDLLDASRDFLAAIAGLTDPQEKRTAVGETFVEVRERYLAEQRLDPEQWLLGQGTLYPDIIESGGTEHAEVIKSHHNRVGMIETLIERGLVVEPLKELYKDEVRALGHELGLPDEVTWRHPFPGPGLSINVLCAAGDENFPEIPENEPRLQSLLEGGPFRATMLPVRSVGVQGDVRTYTPPVALTGARDWDALDATATLIANNLRAANRAVTLLAPAELPPLHPHAGYCTAERLELLRRADHLATRMLEENGLMRDVFQLLVILLPLSASDDANGECVVLRPVASEDVMTARFARIEWGLLDELAAQVLALPGVEAVFYDVSNKPPATFGWE